MDVNDVRTQRVAEPLGLVVMNHGDAQRVQSDDTQHDPVEALSLHHSSDEETNSFFFTPEVRGTFTLTALQAAPSERRSRGRCGSRDKQGPV